MVGGAVLSVMPSTRTPEVEPSPSKLVSDWSTMAWNTGRHIEAWYAIMGIGAVCHTLNPRLFADQLCYIMNHAEDRVIFVDLPFLPILWEHRDRLP